MEMTLNWHDAVFCKTPKALEELADRRHGLRAKARQLLVMLDGSKPLKSLQAPMTAQELHVLVRELKDSGFISHDATKTPPPAAIEPIRITPPTVSPVATEALDPVKLTRAKAYLIEISQQHLGLMAAKLQREIAEANDTVSFRAALAHWNMALRESRSGSGIAGECLLQARKIIGWNL